MKKRKTFTQYMQEVDAYIEKKVGFDSADLIDQPYDRWYEEGVSATTAAKRAIKAEFGNLPL